MDIMNDLIAHLTTSRLVEPEVENKIINEFLKRYEKKFPHVNREHYEMLVRRTVGNFFSEEGIKRWMERTIPYLTPKLLEELKQDKGNLLNFLCRESHPDEYWGYRPLAERV